MPYSTTDLAVKIYDKDAAGLALRATLENGVPPTTANIYAKGCVLIVLDTGVHYRNEGTAAAPNWVIN